MNPFPDVVEVLRERRFDCMVLDLSLPDMDGFALLDTISRDPGLRDLPVVVYTAAELSRKEVTKLKRFAKTIVVKDGKELFMISPRLKRAERYPMDGSVKGPWNDALSLLESGFPRDAASFHRQYQMRSLVETNGLFEFRIQPSSSAARRMISGMLLVVRTNDFLLTATELSLADGSVVRNDFDNLRLNPKLETDTFTPPITPDYKIVEPWKKQP